MQGMISGEELSSAYASADIFMMPSESETLGFVALEAMASGLAVVAVAAGGLVDIITKPGIIGTPQSLIPSAQGLLSYSIQFLSLQSADISPRWVKSREPAGHLYQPGDYTTAASLTRQLIVNPSLRQEMAHAGRQEVETKGWLSAIHRIRDTQYQRAIKTFRAHKR